MPTVGQRFRHLTEAGQLEAYLEEMKAAIRAYMAARDRVDHRLTAPSKDPNKTALFPKTTEEIERLYEKMRTFI